MSSFSRNRFVLQSADVLNQQAKIKVIGVGGGGSNAVDHMVNEQIEGVDFYVANTDAQALGRARVLQKVQFGTELTKGLGAGSNPEIGRDAALEDKNKLVDYLIDADMVFITAGMGGGTGTGATPVISSAIKEANPKVLVVAIVTTPFEFEGRKRMNIAKDGLSELRSAVDSLITIPNEKILEDSKLAIKDAYAQANDVLLNAVQGIAELVIRPGHINVDFADVQTVMTEAGSAMMGTGRATGDDRAVTATHQAIENPLLADVDVSNAKGLLVNITANSNMTTHEMRQIGDIIQEVASEDATIIMGQVFDEEIEDELRVTIVATGLADSINEVDTKPVIEVVGGTDLYSDARFIEEMPNQDGLPSVLRNRSGSPTHPRNQNGNDSLAGSKFGIGTQT